MNKVTVNESYPFDVDFVKDVLIVNKEAIALDVFVANSYTKHILYKNKSYNVELTALDRAEKELKIKVNGNVYSVRITTALDLLLKNLGMDNSSASKVQQVKAPMPGLVISILVVDGQEVRKGDNLLILEAMKMENIIKSPTDGRIQKVEVAQGSKIEKNQVLVKFA